MQNYLYIITYHILQQQDNVSANWECSLEGETYNCAFLLFLVGNNSS